jgi:hypothetical protein
VEGKVALKCNVFSSDFEDFQQSMTDLSHLLLLVGWRLDDANKSVERSLATLERRGLKNKFGAGNGVTLVNVFNKTGLQRAMGGKRITEGENIIPMTKEMEGRYHSYLLVAAYERLEGYLKRVYGRLLYQLRGQVTLRSKRDFHKRKPKWAKEQNTPPYFAAYSQFAGRRSCDEAIVTFKRVLPWDTMVFHLMHGMPFEEIFALLGFCRHCIVHDEGRLPDDVSPPLNFNQFNFIRRCIRKSILTGDDTILPDKRQTGQVLEMLLSYGHALYVLLTEECGMVLEHNYFQR